MRLGLLLATTLALSCCASRPASRTKAASDGAPAPAQRELNAAQMKADLKERQRDEDERRSRDDFINRSQRP